MSKDTDSPVVVRINEDVTAASLISFQGENNNKSEKHGIVRNIEFEFIVTSIKTTSFVIVWLIFLIN